LRSVHRGLLEDVASSFAETRLIAEKYCSVAFTLHGLTATSPKRSFAILFPRPANGGAYGRWIGKE
jgi:hypothetical protein